MGKKREKRIKCEKMLKWWNKQIKFQNNAQMVEKREKTK